VDRGTLQHIWMPARLAERFDGARGDRDAIASLLRRAESERSAGHALFTVGHEERARDLFLRARETTLEAFALVDRDKLGPDGKAALTAAERALAADEDALDGAIIRAHHAIEGLGWSPREVRAVTRRRRFAVLATIATVLGVPWLAVRTMRAPKVTASAQYGQTFLPEMAIDGDVATDWLLPDGATGYLDVHVRPARYISQISIVNGRNRPHNDRGTKAFAVESFHANKAVANEAATFTKQGVNETQTVAIKAKVDRIRIHVRTFFGRGGGIAEVRLE
jgi:hypothetical protein